MSVKVCEQAYDYIQNHIPLLKDKIKEAFNAYLEESFDRIYNESKGRFVNYQQVIHQYDEQLDIELEDKPEEALLKSLLRSVVDLKDHDNGYHDYMLEIREEFSAALCGLDDVIYMTLIAMGDSIIDPQTNKEE